MAGDIASAQFVNRLEEQQRLAAAFAEADAGRASLVLVGGDAGVGKTRLLAEFARGLDAAVLRGGCLPLGEKGLPFAPIVEVLRGLVDREANAVHLPAVLEPLMPEMSLDSSPRASTQSQMFQAFLRLLEELASARAVVLILEDLHWADHSTRQLLDLVAHNLRDQRLLAVATYRTDDLHREHPLRLLLAEWRRNARVDLLKLDAFAPRDVAEHLTAVTGSRPSPEVVEAVVHRTEGNAFFIEELV
ncbi:MAG: AAA family ATPase, partial [Actinomycetota bacterium]